MKAKDFTLPDQDGKTHSLKDYKGKWVLLYFYPKDDTPGCTKEACSFRDARQEYAKNGLTVLGISKDSAASHRRFADKYRLPFTLLSDESKEVIKKYGAWGEKKFLGKTFEGVLRKSFLIDPAGEIMKEYGTVNVLTHAADVLKDFRALAS